MWRNHKQNHYYKMKNKKDENIKKEMVEVKSFIEKKT